MLVVDRPMKKTDGFELVEALSMEDDVDADKLMYTLAFRREVEKGLAAADAGDDIPLEKFETLSEQWLA